MPDILNRTVATPAGDAPVVPILILATGAYLAWFGVHYWRTDTAWPSDPIKAALTGKPIPTPDRSSGEAAIKGIIAGAKASGGATGSSASPTAPTVPGSPGVAMTKAQITALWTSSGGAANTANLAAAVAMAESSGRAWITSPNPDGGTNVGLWQLDTRGVGAGHTVAQLQDPATNARITIMGSANGTKWGQWEAYTAKHYLEYL
jgi:hypothetical protein